MALPHHNCTFVRRIKCSFLRGARCAAPVSAAVQLVVAARDYPLPGTDAVACEIADDLPDLFKFKRPVDLWPYRDTAAMMSAVSSVWIYLLVTEPLTCPTSAAMVASVKPRSFAVLAKLWRRTWGVMSDKGAWSCHQNECLRKSAFKIGLLP
jgi:hypothetical protein